jgi:hypothetical protein
MGKTNKPTLALVSGLTVNNLETTRGIENTITRTDDVGKLLLLPQQHSPHHYQDSTAQKSNNKFLLSKAHAEVDNDSHVLIFEKDFIPSYLVDAAEEGRSHHTKDPPSVLMVSHQNQARRVFFYRFFIRS